MTARTLFPSGSPGTPMVGIFIKSPDVDLARAAAAAGVDFAVVDLEHSMLGMSEVAGILAALDDAGVSPLVRLGVPDPVLVGKVLEAGAAGIQLSNTVAVEQVRIARSASRFPPRGIRGVSFAHRSARWGLDAATYVADDPDGVLIVQVETAATLDPLSDLLLAGADAVFIGLEDLRVSCNAVGMDMEERVNEIIRAAEHAGLPWGCPASMATAPAWVDRGASFVTVGADRALYAAAVSERLGAVRPR